MVAGYDFEDKLEERIVLSGQSKEDQEHAGSGVLCVMDYGIRGTIPIAVGQVPES